MTVKLSPTAQQFFAGRKISRQTLERWPVVSASVQFGRETREAVAFNYLRDGQRVNWKARAIEVKEFTQQTGGEQRFWNLDRVLAGPLDDVFVVEGELDALALSEAGVPDDAILAFPGGAPPLPRSGESAADRQPAQMARYGHVLDAMAAGLVKANRFILAGDNDDVGRLLRKDLVGILGAAKCATVDWPDGVKDANDALMSWGADRLRQHVYENQKPWPIVGLYKLSELPEPPPLEIWEPGFTSWGSSLRFCAPSFSVLTGFPGSGKSVFSQQLWFQIARRYQIRVALLSAERPARPHVRRSLREYIYGQREETLTEKERGIADDFIENHFVFLQHPNAKSSFSWVMDTIEAAVQRYGCRAAIIDPWNKLEADFDGKQSTETMWIGTCLDAVLDAAHGLNAHIQIIAHPAKAPHEYRKEPPTAQSISGSQHWWNKADQCLAVHRPKKVDEYGNRVTEADFYQQKARFDGMGWECGHRIKFNLETRRFEEVPKQ